MEQHSRGARSLIITLFSAKDHLEDRPMLVESICHMKPKAERDSGAERATRTWVIRDL